MDDSFEINHESEELSEESVRDEDDFIERVNQLKKIVPNKQDDFTIMEEGLPDDLLELHEKIQRKQQKKIEQKPKKQSYVPVNQIRTTLIIHLFKLYRDHKTMNNQTEFAFKLSNFLYPTIEMIETKLNQAKNLQEQVSALYQGFALTFQLKNQFSKGIQIYNLSPSEYIITFAQLCKYYGLNVRLVRAFDVGFLGLELKFKIRTIKKTDQESEETEQNTKTIFDLNSQFMTQSDNVESLNKFIFQKSNKKDKTLIVSQELQKQQQQQNENKSQNDLQYELKKSKKKDNKKQQNERQINQDIQTQNQNIWLEFYDSNSNSWIPFDPISDRFVLMDINILKAKLQNSFSHFIIAAQDLTFKDPNFQINRLFGNTHFVDVTLKYSYYFFGQRFQLSLERWFNQLAYNAKLIYKGLQQLVNEPVSANIIVPSPGSYTNEKEFKYSQFYAIASQLSQYQMIHPDAKPIGVKFKDEDIYLQSDVIILHSRDKWREYLREVKLDAQPIKEVSQKFDKTKTTALFALWQTNDIKVSLEDNDGNLPNNAYGNYETFSFPPPKGTRLVRLQGIKQLLSKNNIKFIEAVDGFDSQNGRMFAQKCGYLIFNEDYDKIIALYEQFKIEINEKNKINKKKELLKQWSDLFKTILLKRDLQAKYQQIN
ncbi:unnamed protein product (macronuclear) [Paramecium tetraurelia]|uniref:Death domain-containing protein n=1 Tax=Paramecium tetraurelia TaxID=5888 RepID=A0DTG4_PARTE|nr:uncharacterized protein GSPATT00020012001 [Paramecium tetraurelia]CAK86331.1 unnamed protein product [Paramecium tetraurelia]|eukprot:XP_001453728.1 hypothetical protein (macronuclear) [Paramecium tetraurelia strain d4-2]